MMLRPTLTVFLSLFIPSAAALPSLSGVFACVRVFCFVFFLKKASMEIKRSPHPPKVSEDGQETFRGRLSQR